jgi:hypothetical protein
MVPAVLKANAVARVAPLLVTPPGAIVPAATAVQRSPCPWESNLSGDPTSS